MQEKNQKNYPSRARSAGAAYPGAPAKLGPHDRLDGRVLVAVDLDAGGVGREEDVSEAVAVEPIVLVDVEVPPLHQRLADGFRE